MVPGFDMNNLLREAEVLSRLKHPSIIALKDIFQTESTLYIVTELVTGGEVCARPFIHHSRLFTRFSPLPSFSIDL